MRIKLDEGAFMPLRAHNDDAGLDLRTKERVTVPAHGRAVFDIGVSVEIPHGFYGKIESKSGLNVKHDVVSLGGVIDENFRGSIVVKLYNFSEEDYTFEAGDKIAQLVIMPYLAPEIEIVDELGETGRGSQGFGSTGR